MTYEAGFSDGERQAFKDRRNHVTRSLPDDVRTPYGRGYRDGYMPRSLVWKLREPTAVPWWQEREAETA